MKILLKIDYSNAFNTIRRDHMLRQVKDRAPQAHYYAYQAYAQETDLYYNDTVISSATGVQQGDPMGQALFSLGIHELASRLESPLNVWYLDDATFGGDLETVLSDFKLLIQESSLAGLHLNAAKCELLIVNPSQDEVQQVVDTFRRVAPQIRVVKCEEAVLLVAPLLETSVPRVLRGKLDSFSTLSSRLKFLSVHEALYILKNCLALPKLCLLYTSDAADE